MFAYLAGTACRELPKHRPPEWRVKLVPRSQVARPDCKFLIIGPTPAFKQRHASDDNDKSDCNARLRIQTRDAAIALDKWARYVPCGS
jgi:hypothetical protein